MSSAFFTMPRLHYGDLTKCSPAFQDIVKRNESAYINIFKMFTNRFDFIRFKSSTSSHAFSPHLVQHIVGQGAAQFAQLSISPFQRELLILVTAICAGSKYEWQQHVPISEACGVTEAMRKAIKVLSEATIGTCIKTDTFTKAFPRVEDRVLLHFVHIINRSAVMKDYDFALVQRHFDPQQIVEVLICHGYVRHFSLYR